jgi:hypothetical protein
MAEISLIILEILRVLSSYICSLELDVWSKSFIMDLSSRTLTLNFSSALEKWRILLMFLISVIRSEMSSYF